MSATIEKIVESVLVQNNIRDYDKKDLELQLQIHPSYPSFQSITDTLDYFSIDNIAVEVPKEALDQLPESFVSLINTEKGEEIVSVIKGESHITLKHAPQKKKKYSSEEFKEIWVPKVIAVEYNSAQKLFQSNRSVLQVALFSLLAIGLGISIYNRSWDLTQIVFILLSITGTVFSYFALRESLGMQSQAMHQFCNSIGNSSCNDVINNNSGKIFGKISLADAGMIFFSTVTLFQIFYGFDTVLLISSLLGIPIVIYSLYAQAFVVKKWCAICLAIGIISIGLAAVAFFNLPFTLYFYPTINFVVVLSIVALLYFFLKEKIEENKKYKGDNLKLNQFKRDEQIYTHLMELSEKIKDNSSIENEIVLGNPKAPLKIIALTNPMCGYCKDAFEAYTRVLKSLGDQLQIRIRFNVNVEDTNNEAAQIVFTLFDIYSKKGADGFVEAYNNWFTDRTHSKWMKKHSIPQNFNEISEVVKKQSEWAQQNNVYYTPASLINDTLYPQKYSYSEFFHFINLTVEKYKNVMLPDQESIEA